MGAGKKTLKREMRNIQFSQSFHFSCATHYLFDYNVRLNDPGFRIRHVDFFAIFLRKMDDLLRFMLDRFLFLLVVLHSASLDPLYVSSNILADRMCLGEGVGAHTAS